MKSFRPDFTKVRVSPRLVQPWRRYEATWDDIMNEIGDEVVLGGLNQLTQHEIIGKRLDITERRLETVEKRLVENISLAISNQKLIEQMSENQTELFRLMERYFGKPDGI